MAEARAQNTYRVTERLESGGMAEVFRGESTSFAGFKKQVAIKRVLPHLASNEKFIRMFLDEARLSARLSHANIVQVFDIGHVENTYFIVMEFIEGVNLKALISYLRERKQPFPMPVACYIAVKVCEGLHYAHEATDNDGNRLGIVHRDVSPPNVLLSRRGEIKIVDFGLAKAAHSVEKTEPGVVKGKFSYLSPETAMGEEADPQADIYAVGIMLWEMLAGRKLFQGDNDYQTVKLVQQSNVPSLRAINSAVPDDLEKIIRHALARGKADRYQTAQAMSEDLSEFLVLHRMKATPFDLGKLVNEVMVEKATSRQNVRNDGSVIDQLIQEELLRFTSLGEPNASPGGNSAVTPDPLQEGAKPLDAEDFVNLNDWAPGLVGDAFDPHNGGALWQDPSGGISSASIPGSLADELEGDVQTSLPPVVSARPVPIQSPPPPAEPSEPVAPVVTAAGSGTAGGATNDNGGLVHTRRFKSLPVPPEPASKFPVGIAVGAVLLLCIVGGLFFTGILKIPH
jgi:serine/threonine-protein kinase